MPEHARDHQRLVPMRLTTSSAIEVTAFFCGLAIAIMNGQSGKQQQRVRSRRSAPPVPRRSAPRSTAPDGAHIADIAVGAGGASDGRLVDAAFGDGNTDREGDREHPDSGQGRGDDEIDLRNCSSGVCASMR